MTATLQLRLAGPAPGESYLFMKWLSKRYGTHVAEIKLRVGNADLFDRLLAMEFADEGGLVRVAAPFPEPAAAPAVVREALLRRIDGAMVVLARAREAVEDNANAVQQFVPHLNTIGIEPVVVMNDSTRGGAKTALSAAAAAGELRLGSPVYDTMLGPLRGPLEYDDGVEAAWSILLEKGRKRRGATAYR